MRIIPVLLLALAAAVSTATGEERVFPARTESVLRVQLDKGDLLLESIQRIIDKHGVKDGAVLTAVGALDVCTFHGVGGTKQTIQEDMEINHLGGMIANGAPHLHVFLTNAKRGGFGGHLENGCRVGNRVELTIAKFAGEALDRGKSGLAKKQ